MAEGSLEEEVQYMVTEVWGWEVWGAGTTEILKTAACEIKGSRNRREKARMGRRGFFMLLTSII